MRRPKPVPGWQRAWRWWSVQIAALGVVLPQAWAVMPDDLKEHIPPEWLPGIASMAFGGIILARLVSQDDE